MTKTVASFLTLQNARRLTQALFLLLFLFLFIQTESKGNDELGYPVRLFLDFDPLILVTTLLSAHARRRGLRAVARHDRHHPAVRQGLLRLGLPPGHPEQPGRIAAAQAARRGLCPLVSREVLSADRGPRLGPVHAPARRASWTRFRS